MLSEDERETLVEDVLDDSDGFGFRVKWNFYDYWANVEVYQVEVIVYETNVKEFPMAGGNSADTTPDISGAEMYLKGYVKWDGCTELEQGCHHWCGPHGYKQHINLLKYIYRRAMELMNRESEWIRVEVIDNAR